jgi:hypothetical protein
LNGLISTSGPLEKVISFAGMGMVTTGKTRVYFSRRADQKHVADPIMRALRAGYKINLGR